ncbi:MAG: tRNA pseudouridine(55) synthase TruB [Candidatus Pacearchaeota archaeon]
MNEQVVEKSGIVFLDKPYGISSHHATQLVKKILNAKKAGHTGTLDEKVTGLLIVLINKATRLAWLFNLDKSYVGVARLHADVSLNKLRASCKRFIGKIEQLPPRRSVVARKLRQREIYEFKIVEKAGRDFLFKVRCQAGTYIRKLIHDLGQDLGGAHMLELRRIAIGPFKESSAVTLYELEKNPKLIPAEKVLSRIYKSVALSKAQAKRFCNGSWIWLNDLKVKNVKSLKEGEIILTFYKKKFLGIGIVQASQIRPKTILSI